MFSLEHSPEGVLELALHGLHVRVLHKECGAKLAELGKLDLPAPVLVNLQQQVLQLLLGGPEPHGTHNLAKVISRQKINLFCVEQVKACLQRKENGKKIKL